MFDAANRAEQVLELVGGGDLEDAERAEDIGAHGIGRAVRVGGAAPVRGPYRPGQIGRYDGVGLVVVVVGLVGALTGVHGPLPVLVVGCCL
ncbi:hypothetical protein KCMC57_up62770 [Kitasatospora sp. CMC57]|uniref:Uncharacterized protein n=1 Tax=Kitasatospora sp. CMC57 TaxID=3231513 RepID=A0AB33K6R3_9ACTN